MEACIETIQSSPQVWELQNPQLRVPCHEPYQRGPQPPQKPETCIVATAAPVPDKPFTKTSSVPLEEPVDSVHNSLHREKNPIVASVAQDSQAIPVVASSQLSQSLQEDGIQNDIQHRDPEGLPGQLQLQHNEQVSSPSTLKSLRPEQNPFPRVEVLPEKGPSPTQLGEHDAVQEHPQRTTTRSAQGLSPTEQGQYPRQIADSRDVIQLTSPRTLQEVSISSKLAKPASTLLFWRRLKAPLTRSVKKAVMNTGTTNPQVIGVPSNIPLKVVSRPEQSLNIAQTVRNGTEDSGTTSITVAPPLGQLVTPNSSTISILITSKALHSPEKGLYVGLLKEIAPSGELQRKWLTTVRGRLVNDLRPVLSSLPLSLDRSETVIELDLCMSGRVENKSDTVRLKPTIWIRCGSIRCRRDISAAMKDLTYLGEFIVEIHLHAPHLASACLRTPKRDIACRRQDLPSSSPSPSGPSKTGVIAGAVGGGIGVGLILVMLFFFIFWRRRKRNLRGQGLPSDNSVDPSKMRSVPSEMISAECANELPHERFIFEMPSMSISELNSADYAIQSSRGRPVPPVAKMLSEPWPSPVESLSHVRSLPALSRMTVSEDESSSLQLSVKKNKLMIQKRGSTQRFCCTIGGLVSIDDTVWGLTTAHSLLGAYDSCGSHGSHGSHSSDAIDTHLGPVYTSEITNGTLPHELSYSGVLSHAPTSDIATSWKEMSSAKLGIACYDQRCLGPLDYNERRSTFPEGTDFALIKFENSFSNLHNIYKTVDQRVSPAECRIDHVSTELNSGVVSILCSPDDVRSGYLLGGSALFMDRASIFTSMKIQLDAPLGKYHCSQSLLQNISY
jgi:hypothetical protein